jgi:lauroyl/myristoyl acyltransferase
MADKNGEAFLTRAGPTRAALALSKWLPPAPAEVLSRVVARVLVTAKPANYRGASDNLRHMLPHGTSEREHRRTLYRLFYNAAKSYYHLFHNLAYSNDPRTFRPPVRMTDDVRRFVDQAVKTGRGLFIAASHTSNFDLAGIAMTQYLPKPVQVLSIANPTSGYEFMNRMRTNDNGTVTPITPASLRDAIQRLRDGGIVMTGTDHPIAGGNRPLTFFGHTACLPTGYMRIPMMANALVMTLANHYDGETYWIVGNRPMELERTGDRAHDIKTNAQRVLSQLETFIRRAPDQWMVFDPIFANDDTDRTTHSAEA